ncbi:MAG: hypothetical protein J6X11_06095 [Treponema sp.]|nr:hypothetical protein [Treponema sp.]
MMSTHIFKILSVFLFSLGFVFNTGCASKQEEKKEAVVVQQPKKPVATQPKKVVNKVEKKPVAKPVVQEKKPEVQEKKPVVQVKEEVKPVVSEPEAPKVEEVQNVIPEPDPESQVAVLEDIPTPAKKEPVAEVKEPVVEETVPEVPVSDEYERSVSKIRGTVTKETFEEDKKEILQIIDQLKNIMISSNYTAWLKYVDEESKVYWSNRENLKKVAALKKGLQLNYLKDYFLKIFVPARKGRRVDEIRYETDTQVKAVQVNEGNDTIYYDFKKVNGQWKVHLPPITD